MKTNQFKLTLLAVLASIVVILSFSSCVNKAPFLSSAVVPAAKGTVKVKKDNNQNYLVQIKISNLAGPERLTPPRSTYVVWLMSADDNIKNIGQINISNSLSASFETVSAFRPTKIIVTAEDGPNVLYPSNTDIVLTTDYLK